MSLLATMLLIFWTFLILHGVLTAEGAGSRCLSPFSYHIIKQTLSFARAKKSCKIFYNGSVPTLSQHRTKLLHIMRQNDLNRIWIAVHRRMMAEWQWVDNSSFKRCLPAHMYDDTFLKSDNAHHCAILYIPEQKIKPFPCYSPQVCFICSLPGDAICDINKFKKCFTVNNYWMTIGDKANSWFTARQQCRKSGGDLITINNEEKILDIIGEVEKPPKSFDCDKLFIGLHLDKWVDGTSYSEIIEEDVWLENEPKRDNCAELVVKEDNQTGLKSIDCLEPNHVICAYQNKTQPADVIVQGRGKEIHPALLFLIIILAVLLLSVTIVIICRLRRRKPRRRTGRLI